MIVSRKMAEKTIRLLVKALQRNSTWKFAFVDLHQFW